MRQRRIRVRRWISLAGGGLVAAILMIAGSAQNAAAQTGDRVRIVSVDSASHPAVTLMVEPPAALADTQLPAEAFTLTENGRRLPVTTERLGSSMSAQHLNVVLVMDTSGSMQGAPLEAAKAAAQNFVSSLPDGTHVGVVGFGDAPYVVAPVGSDPADVVRMVSTREGAHPLPGRS